jgi:uncharacterized protein (DUF427 family)
MSEPAPKTIKIPDDSHPITITPHTDEVVVTVAGKVVARTRRALALKEASYPVVYYIPREDADMYLLRASKHTSYCPYKGDCSYFHIPVGGAASRDAVWSYENPYDAVAAIKDHLAFYPDRVTSIA